MEILARAVGRRKEAVAQVQIIRGTGKFIINNKAAQEYLQNNSCSLISVKAPLNCLTLSDNENNLNSIEKIENPSFQTKNKGSSSVYDEVGLNSFAKQLETMDTIVKVKGGGLIGQAEAIKLAVARALCLVGESLSPSIGEFDARRPLKNKGYLTQDSRVKERRKYGLKKARKASQYHKR